MLIQFHPGLMVLHVSSDVSGIIRFEMDRLPDVREGRFFPLGQPIELRTKVVRVVDRKIRITKFGLLNVRAFFKLGQI